MIQSNTRQAIERQGHEHHSKSHQHVAYGVKADHALQCGIWHVNQGGDRADHADRDVDQKDPVPGGDLNQPASQRRSNQRTNQTRHSDETHRRQEVTARK